LRTPTRIELEPGNDVQVTLLDANRKFSQECFHSPQDLLTMSFRLCWCSYVSYVSGLNKYAVLIGIVFESKDTAVIYTGDIRSEPWFVTNLLRDPFLIEYTSGQKTLDCVYLDTSNLEPTHFPTKAEGLAELLRKVKTYPSTTVFHFSAWTFGYEDVWIALSRALGSKV
jgi:DNA cross-link repair 1C protein